MTVKDLIDALTKLPDDAKVVINEACGCYYGGWEEIEAPEYDKYHNQVKITT